MPIIKKTLRVEKYNRLNKNDFENILAKHVYFIDLKGFNFDLIPDATVYFLRGDLWIYKDLILGFCVINDCSRALINMKLMYGEACNIDSCDMRKYNGIILQELGIMQRYRKKGLGKKYFNLFLMIIHHIK